MNLDSEQNTQEMAAEKERRRKAEKLRQAWLPPKRPVGRPKKVGPPRFVDIESVPLPYIRPPAKQTGKEVKNPQVS